VRRSTEGSGWNGRDDVANEAPLHCVRLDHDEGALTLLHVERRQAAAGGAQRGHTPAYRGQGIRRECQGGDSLLGGAQNTYSSPGIRTQQRQSAWQWIDGKRSQRPDCEQTECQRQKRQKLRRGPPAVATRELSDRANITHPHPHVRVLQLPAIIHEPPSSDKHSTVAAHVLERDALGWRILAAAHNNASARVQA
jgi:hypothetical protein